VIPPGIEIVALHSALVSDDGENISLYLDLSDGSTASVYVSFADLRQRAHIIEEATQAPAGVALQ
jgi:hypothetical protein